MDVKIPDTIIEGHTKTTALAAEIRTLRLKPRLTESDLKQLAELRAELMTNLPPERFAWLDGKPVIDIIDELIKISQENS